MIQMGLALNCSHCTGCPFDAVWTSKLAMLMFKSLHGCAPSYRMQVGAWGQLTSPLIWRHHMSYSAPELVWVTGRLMSLDCGFGTSCLLHCGHLTVSASSEDNWRHICSARTRLRHLVTLAFRRKILILSLTYLHTYNIAPLWIEVKIPNAPPFRIFFPHLKFRILLVACIQASAFYSSPLFTYSVTLGLRLGCGQLSFDIK